MSETQAKRERALLIVGRTGNGKSSTGNTILQYAPAIAQTVQDGATLNQKASTEPFSVAHCLNSDTKSCETEICRFGDHLIKVINTPDVENLELNVKDRNAELVRWTTAIGQSDCTVLLVIRANARYTPADHDTYQMIKQSKRFNNYPLLVVFTMGGFLNGRDLRADLVNASKELQQVLADARWRYVVFDNVPQQEGAAVGDRIKSACVQTLMDALQRDAPHPFPQQVCRLLVTGQNEEEMEMVVKILLDGKTSRVRGRHVQFLHGTTALGLRLEVTVCTAQVLSKSPQTVQLSLCPGPHAILRVNSWSPSDTELRRALGEQGRLNIRSTHTLQLDISDFVIEISMETDESRVPKEITSGINARVLALDHTPQMVTKILDAVKDVATPTFYMSEDMLRLSDSVQKRIANTQAAYSKYLEVKELMVKEKLV